MDEFQRHADQGRLRDSDVRIRTKHGEMRDVLLSTELIELDSKSQCLLTLIHDITERKRAEHELASSREQLRELSVRLVHAQEDERRALAYELHDEIGQQLTGLNLMLELGAYIPPEQLRSVLHNAQTLVNGLTSQVRKLSLELRPPMLDELGLQATLRWQIEQFARQTGIIIDFQYRGLEAALPPAVAIAAYRIVQEGLTNIARHAQSRTVEVRVSIGVNQLDLELEDHGRGFDQEETREAARSVGLVGMRERVQLLGGTFTLESTPGTGTCIRVCIPLDYSAPG
jgi:two-component system sensor histidine kinase UhpB